MIAAGAIAYNPQGRFHTTDRVPIQAASYRAPAKLCQGKKGHIPLLLSSYYFAVLPTLYPRLVAVAKSQLLALSLQS